MLCLHFQELTTKLNVDVESDPSKIQITFHWEYRKDGIQRKSFHIWIFVLMKKIS